jgi:hypothetical protein
MVYPRTKVALVENHSKIVYGARPSPYKRPNTARSPQRALPAGRSLPLSNEKAKSGVKVALRGLPTAPLQSPFGCPSLRSASPLRAFIRSGTSPAIRSKPLFSASGSLAPPPPFKVSPLAILSALSFSDGFRSSNASALFTPPTFWVRSRAGSACFAVLSSCL